MIAKYKLSRLFVTLSIITWDGQIWLDSMSRPLKKIMNHRQNNLLVEQEVLVLLASRLINNLLQMSLTEYSPV